MTTRGVILVHGGAGAMRSMGGQREAAYRAGLRAAAAAGRDVLAAGADAMAAVVAANRVMEDAGCFNAGLGSCLDERGEYALDAAVMRGSDREAGAVGALSATHHAVTLAHELLAHRHVLIVGLGADDLARELGLPAIPPPPADKLATYAKLRASKAERLEDLATVGRPDDDDDDAGVKPSPEDTSHDTVGAVALDSSGLLAAAVTTGGLWLKTRGRVGDSPLVGAGLFACNALGGAAVATGIGERLLKDLSCFRACQLVESSDAGAAAERAVAELAQRFGPDTGGLIVVDREGRLGAAFNTSGMGRALARVGQDEVPVAVWPEEPFPLA